MKGRNTKPTLRLTKLADKHVFQNDTGPGEWVMIVDEDLRKWLAEQGLNMEPCYPVEFSEDEMAYALEGVGYAYIMLPEDVSVLYQMTFS